RRRLVAWCGRVDSAADGGKPDGRQDPEEATQEEAAEEAQGLVPADPRPVFLAWRGRLLVPWFSGWWSGRRGSTPRHAAWKAAALPTELLPRRCSEDISSWCAVRR